MIWLMCITNRVEQSLHIENIWKSQTCKCNLLIVDNCLGNYFGNSTIYIKTEPNNPIIALNTGIEYLKKNHPDDIWARIDDDDEYSCNYVNEIDELFQDKNVIFSGIPQHRVQLQDEIVIFGSRHYLGGPGGSLAARVYDSMYFPDVWPCEDQAWCYEMIQSHQFGSRSSDNFIRVRNGRNSTLMSDDMIRLFSDFD